MVIYDHDQTAVGEVDQRWIPLLRGDIFCSPSCGGNCKKSAYDEALQKSNAVASLLGEGWTPQIYENLGWYWQVVKGNIEVIPINNGYSAILQFNLNEENYYFREDGLEPRIVVEKVRHQLLEIIKKLERQFASSALDPISIATHSTE